MRDQGNISSRELTFECGCIDITQWGPHFCARIMADMSEAHTGIGSYARGHFQ